MPGSTPAAAASIAAADSVAPRSGAQRWQKASAVMAAGSGSIAAGSAGYMLGGPVLKAAVVITAAVAAVAVIVVLSAMLGRRDPRSPFVRLMLVICVITGRRPRDYLPPARGTRGPDVP